MTISTYKHLFPIFQNNQNLVFLDNAATTQKPQILLDSLCNYYSNYNSNINRSSYDIARISSDKFEYTRNCVAKLLETENSNIVFTKGTTESCNIIANSYCDKNLTSKSLIITSDLEHHSNYLPFYNISNKLGCKLKYINLYKIDSVDTSLSYHLNLDELDNYLNENKNTFDKIFIVISAASNVTGSVTYLEKLYEIKQKYNCIIALDCAQYIPHFILDPDSTKLSELSKFDFISFSAHKMFGPTGLGILYINPNIHNDISINYFGGDMVSFVNKDEVIYKKIPNLLEAGTQNIADIISFGSVLELLIILRTDGRIYDYLYGLEMYMLELLSKFPNIVIYHNPHHISSLGIFSFNLYTKDNILIHPHDIAEILNSYNICIRTGQHCTGILHESLGINATCRASITFYNDKSDIDKFIDSLNEVIKIFE